MKAFIITVGNELLIGDTVNTNAAWLGSFLTSYNGEPVKSVTIGDDKSQIIKALDEGFSTADFIVMTGGLGPTHDDITKKTVAEYFGAGYKVHQPTRDFIEKVFNKRGIPITASNLEQSRVPDNCSVLFNKNGTAPGMWFEHGEKILAVLPGVPFEMKYLMENEVLPRIRNVSGKQAFLYRHYFQTSGIGESTLSDNVIGDLQEHFSNGLQLAYLPHTHGVTLRVTSSGESAEHARENAEPLIGRIRESASDWIFSENQHEKLENVLGKLLLERNLTISTAESCTGGLIGSKITDVPGSSEWFCGGVTAYSNELKVKLLGVPAECIEKYGAVSGQAAQAMAKGITTLTGADIGVAVTGIAGPGGGTDEKPVGLVWFGYYDRDSHFSLKVRLFKDRILNKKRAAHIAMDIVRRKILGIKVMPYNLETRFLE